MWMASCSAPDNTASGRAAELRNQFPHGVFLVPLAPLADPDLVVPTIFERLGLTDAGGAPPADRLREYVQDRALLAVLNNFEHVRPAGYHFRLSAHNTNATSGTEPQPDMRGSVSMAP
jgi:hypothetical protein